MRALDLPTSISASTDCQELLRVWIDRGKISISISHALPAGWHKPEKVWALLLSDIFHQVVQCISTETKIPAEEVGRRIEYAYYLARKSERQCRAGITKEITSPQRELPTPDIVGDDTSVELARLVDLEESIATIVRVGGWLPDNEEDMWGGILYDLACLIAVSIQPKRPKTAQSELLKALHHYLKNPTTVYRGQFYE